MKTLQHNLLQLVLIFDQLLNVIRGLLTFDKADATETLSSAAFRAHRAYVKADKKDKHKYLLGHLCMNLINFIFFWDKVKIKDYTMYHCEKAYNNWLRVGAGTVEDNVLFNEIEKIVGNEPDKIIDLMRLYKKKF